MKYNVRFWYTTFLEETVEANSPDEAIEKANKIVDDMDDKTFTERRVDNLCYDYTEVEDEEGNLY
jgi:hypothetical protein